jgi:glycerate 2-kinase
MKIVIAPQTFKGTLSALEVTQAIAKGIKRVYPQAELKLVPVADGGDGTLDVLMKAWGGKIKTTLVSEALNRKTLCRWGNSSETAIIELAEVCGLSRLKSHESNPYITSTYGVGEILQEALKQGCRCLIIGVGGSATNDGGTGLLRALGVRFLDREGEELPLGGGYLNQLREVDDEKMNPLIFQAQLTILCDVSNPLLGPKGASLFFSRQKGADSDMANQLEEGMKNFAQIVKRSLGIDLEQIEGGGAAGGTAAGMCAFLRSQLVSGSDFILKQLKFDQILEEADLVITGEGRLDTQTLCNKAPYRVATLAKQHHLPVFAIVGSVENSNPFNHLFDQIFALSNSGAIPLNSNELITEISEKALRSWNN